MRHAVADPPPPGYVDAEAALRRACDAAGSMASWADRHGVDTGNLSRMLSGTRPLSDAVLQALGLERVVTFLRRP